MRRVALAIVSTVSGLVLLLNFKTHPTAAVSTGPSTIAATPAPPTSSSAGPTTVTGDAVETRYGPVQVQLTVTNGKVTKVSAVDYPHDNPRDEQINGYAIPTLDAEATRAGNATIDMVSGATYTSEGYLQSLQSALNKAGL